MVALRLVGASRESIVRQLTPVGKIMGAWTRYLQGIHDKFDHLATWLPDDMMCLGDVGVITGGRFFRKTTLETLRIRFNVRAGNAGGDWDHSSGSDVKVNFGANAQTSAPGTLAGHAVVNFGSSGAFLFQALGCSTTTIEDMANVGDQIILAFRAKDYAADWIVIDRLVTARNITVLISDSEKSSIELGAKGALAALPSLADASLGISAEKWEGEVTRYVAKPGLTPMFGASHLHKSLFGKVTVNPFRSEDSGRETAPEKLTSVTVAYQVR